MGPVWPNWRFIVSLIFLSAIMIQTSTAIKCVHCMDKVASPDPSSGDGSSADFSCTAMRKWVAYDCSSDQYACFKQVTFNAGRDAFGRMRHVVRRDCLDPHAQNYSSLQFCDRGERRGPASPGYGGVVCLCNTDYCNGSLVLRLQAGMLILAATVFLVLN